MIIQRFLGEQFKKIVLLCVLILAQSIYVFGQFSEYEIKAAYIEKIAKFVEWNNSSARPDSSSFEIAILGKNPFGETLNNFFEGLSIDNRTAKIKNAKNLEDIRSSDLVFVSSSMENDLKKIVNTARENGILLIGDTKGFANQGVQINFYLKDNKVRFEINADAIKKSGLKISYHLFQYARIIKSEE